MVVGGAIGRRPMAGPKTTRIAALSIDRLCHATSRRFDQPFQTMIAKGMMTARGTIVQVERIGERRLIGALNLPDCGKIHDRHHQHGEKHGQLAELHVDGVLARGISCVCATMASIHKVKTLPWNMHRAGSVGSGAATACSRADRSSARSRA